MLSGRRYFFGKKCVLTQVALLPLHRQRETSLEFSALPSCCSVHVFSFCFRSRLLLSWFFNFWICLLYWVIFRFLNCACLLTLLLHYILDYMLVFTAPKIKYQTHWKIHTIIHEIHLWGFCLICLFLSKWIVFKYLKPVWCLLQSCEAQKYVWRD